MNERIKELAIKAGGGPSKWYTDPEVLEYFAELIILECEKVAKDPQWYSVSPSNGWRNPINYVCNVMKDHFGVEK